MNPISAIFRILLAMTLTTVAQAQTVEVKNAWVRVTVQGQKATGAFMQITAPAATTLVAVTTPVAGVAEVHEMKMDGDVMRMRPLAKGLELPAGKAVQLKPGGYHLMLMDLKLPLQKDTTIPITLTLQDSKGAQSTQDLRVPVLTAAPGGPAEHQHSH
ncbi:MAG: copper chaperone PCu(A)C [Betaproteobacteria bacterium]|nr:copper chaperone PCu(A)C [Betaproteobacteria bacterium]